MLSNTAAFSAGECAALLGLDAFSSNAIQSVTWKPVRSRVAAIENISACRRRRTWLLSPPCGLLAPSRGRFSSGGSGGRRGGLTKVDLQQREV